MDVTDSACTRRSIERSLKKMNLKDGYGKARLRSQERCQSMQHLVARHLARTLFRPLQIKCIVRFNILRQPQQIHSGRIKAALPDDKNPPSLIDQTLNLPFVSRHILVELLNPAITILRWRGRESASGVPVPETSMHKNCQVIFDQYNIWAAG